MKKIISTLLFTFITGSVFAQTNSFGIKGGLNFSTQPGDKSAEGTLRGFNVGGGYNIQFEAFAFQPGLSFNTKGVKERLEVVDPATFTRHSVIQDVKLSYVQMPVNLLHKFPTRRAVRFFVGGGTYLAYAVAGSTAMTGQAKTDISFDDYNRIDFGFNAIGGIELFKKIVLNINYDLSIADVSFIQTHHNISNATLSYSVGYLF
jgi:hypothetical protein